MPKTHIVYAFNSPMGGPNDILGWYDSLDAATAAAREAKWENTTVRIHGFAAGVIIVVSIPSQPVDESGPWLVYAYDGNGTGGNTDLVSPTTGFTNWDDAWTCGQNNLTKDSVAIVDTSTQNTRWIKGGA